MTSETINVRIRTSEHGEHKRIMERLGCKTWADYAAWLLEHAQRAEEREWGKKRADAYRRALADRALEAVR